MQFIPHTIEDLYLGPHTVPLLHTTTSESAGALCSCLCWRLFPRPPSLSPHPSRLTHVSPWLWPHFLQADDQSFFWAPSVH